MSKVYTLVDSIRDTLNDPDGDRWTNSRILRSINDATKDINLSTSILRGRGSFSILAGTHTYKLPDNVQLISKVLYKGEPVEFKSHSQMDDIDSSWELHYGNVIKYIVYDKLNMSNLRVYPTPQIPSLDIDSFGIITDLGDISIDSPFGVITDVYYPLYDIVLYYIYKPELVVGLNDDLPFNDLWDTAIKHYVCGFLLRDDKDTQNRLFGNEELKLFDRYLQEASRLSSLDYKEGSNYETKYRSI